VAEEVQDEFGEDLVHVLHVEVDPLGDRRRGPAQAVREPVPQLGGARRRRWVRDHLLERAVEAIAIKSRWPRVGVAEFWRE